MRRVRFYRSRWFKTGFAVLMLMLLTWFVGPMFGFGATHPLETDIARWIVIAALFVLWLFSNLLHMLGDNKREKRLAEGIAEASPEAKAADARVKEAERASAEEAAALRDRLMKAMTALQKSKLGGSRKRLALMPWYMIIGPPGAGKTTALRNSGLRFPLETAKGSIAGVGGTRNCEWMFTDEAVLIDTAGRYTTQDSAEAVDSAGWLGFLDLLKMHRRHQPLNGVLVAISLSDLAGLDDAERQAHARAVRSRVRELYDRLGVRLPIYVLFTKADMLAGFSEYFDNLGREEREQVWGITFPMDQESPPEDDESEIIRQFGPEFDLLIRRLNEGLLERVHQEPDIRRRRLIYGFPQQVASFREVASAFLDDAFRSSRLEARPLLRGAYFTSGTQDGTPIDRLLGTMSAEFGLPRQALAAASGPGRSYFLQRLLREVVLGEAALAGLDPKVERRAKWISIGAWSTCAIVLLVLAGSWAASYVGNVYLISQVHAGVASYTARLAELERRGPGDQDLAATLPALDALRNIRGGYSERDHDAPIGLTFGLYQGSKLSRAAQDSYVNALNRILLPRLLTRVEAQMAARMNNTDFLYQTLKVYLVLGRNGPLDRDLVGQWVDADLATAYPGEENEATRQALLGHVEAMLEQPLAPIALNEPLIAQARAELKKEPLAEYSYNRLMRSKRVVAIPVWSPAENGGPGVGRVFVYKSGRSLETGVPGIYTWAGYHRVFQPLLLEVTQDISEDSWVLGHEKRDVQTTIRDTSRLRKDVLGLYLDDYTRRWDALLGDVAIKPATTTQQALDSLSLLSAPASPLRDLLQAIDAQVTLTRPAATDAAVAAGQARTLKVAPRLAGFAAFEARSGLSIRQNEVASIFMEAFSTNDSSGKPVDPASRVDDHFKMFHEFVMPGENGKPSGLEQAIQRILALYQAMNLAATAAPGSAGTGLFALTSSGAEGGVPGPAAQLQDMTRSMPPEVAALLGPVARNATQIGATAAGNEIQDAWKQQILPLCAASLNRYPFVANSRDDAPIDDFTALLATGGSVEKFFNHYVKSFADTTQKPWRWQASVPLGLNPASLAQFEAAAQIRDGLFGSGTTFQVRFNLIPLTMDPAVGQISLEIGGQSMTYAHEPPQSQPFAWPGPGGKNLVRITMTPANGANATTVTSDGAWALLHALDGKIAAGAQPDKFKVTFTGGGGAAVFELTASSVRNPFTLGAFRSFRCPAKL